MLAFPTAYRGDYFYADYCAGWIRRIDPVTGIGRRLRERHRQSGRPQGRPRRRALLPGTRRRDRRADQLRRGRAARRSRCSRRTARSRSDIGHLHGRRHRQRAARLPVATQRQPDRRARPVRATRSPTHSSPTAARSSTSSCRTTSARRPATPRSSPSRRTRRPLRRSRSPSAGRPTRAASVINYAGTGNDAEDGVLPASAFTWWVDLHHDTPYASAHGLTVSGSKTGSFTIPTIGETSANVFYRIHLRVTDSGGLTRSVSRDIQPRKSTVTLATNPAGLQLRLDGQPVTTPHSFVGVVGIVRSLEAVSPQGASWVFSSWSDGGARVHDISTPTADTTYTAQFVAQPAVSIAIANVSMFEGNSGTEHRRLPGHLSGASATPVERRLEDDQRLGEVRQRLHGGQRHGHLPRGQHLAHDRGHDKRRHRGGGEGNLLRRLVRAVRRYHRRRTRGRVHQERRWNRNDRLRRIDVSKSRERRQCDDHRDAQWWAWRRNDGPLRDHERDGKRRHRLHGNERHPDLRRGCDIVRASRSRSRTTRATKSPRP